MFSKIIRRTHMYLALFLTPWMLMYALSTMAMNHRESLRKHYGAGPPQFEKEREARIPPGTFSAEDPPAQKAANVLRYLGMEGAHNLPKPAADGALVIMRHGLTTPRRITVHSSEPVAVIERQVFRMPAFLERAHRRRGYQQDHPADDAWAFSVDLVIVVMVFWVLSGLWMWWEMKPARRWGAVSAVAGLALFALLLGVL